MFIDQHYIIFSTFSSKIIELFAWKLIEVEKMGEQNLK